MADISQSAAGGFLFPLFGIAVSLKTNGLRSDDCFFQNTENSFIFANSFFHEFFNGYFEFVQLVGHCCIYGNHGSGAVGRRAGSTEFKTITRESERRGAVTVCRI